MADAPTYPKRPKFFAAKFCRLVMKACVANELGPEAALLLMSVANTEDARGYRGPVNYWNGQLLPLVGCRSDSALKRVRAKCERAGWLVCVPGTKWSPPSYWVAIPPQHDGWDDAPSDDGADDHGSLAAPSPPTSGRQADDDRAASGRRAGGERPDSFPVPVPIPSVPSERTAGQPAEEPAKEKKPRKEPAGPHPEACRMFTARWAEAYPASDPYPFEAKDGAAAAAILKHVGADLEKFRAILDRYFANTDRFFAGHSLPKLRGSLSQFMAEAPRAPPPRSGFRTRTDELYDHLEV